MSKLNKQEKAYAVRRIHDEIRDIISAKMGSPPPYANCFDEVKKAINSGTAKLKPQKEIMSTISRVILDRWSQTVGVCDLIVSPIGFVKANNALEKYTKDCEALRQKLLKKAQPLIDEIQLGQADAVRLSEMYSILRG